MRYLQDLNVFCVVVNSNYSTHQKLDKSLCILKSAIGKRHRQHNYLVLGYRNCPWQALLSSFWSIYCL